MGRWDCSGRMGCGEFLGGIWEVWYGLLNENVG
jgi:hypothetical protein